MVAARRIGKDVHSVGQVIPLEEKSSARLIEPLSELAPELELQGHPLDYWRRQAESLGCMEVT